MAEGELETGGARAHCLGSPTPSSVEVDLVKWLAEVVIVPTKVLREKSEDCAALAMVVRSLGWWVSMEMASREFRLRAGLKGEVAGFNLDNRFAMFCFQEAGEREMVLRWLWVVAGQVLAVESWQLGFFSLEGAICSALVWVRLSQLPVEFWGEVALQDVLRLVGELLLVDECMTETKQSGFARACIRIDLSWPLRPGVLRMGPEGPFW